MQALAAAPREDLDPALVAEALSLQRPPTVRHGLDVLDRTDTPTGERLPFEPGGSVDWSYRAPDRVAGQSDAVAAVRRQATLTVPADTSVNLSSVRLRIWTEWLLLDGTWARFYLGVFPIVTPGAIVDDGVVVRRTLQCADKSYAWANKAIPEPVHVPAGTDVAAWVRADAFAAFGETRFAIATGSTTTLSQPRTFEAGTSYLEVWSRLFEAIGNDQAIADEYGRLASRPLSDLAAREPEHTYGAGQGKILTAGQVEPLLPTLPNVVRFSARQGPSLGNVIGNGLAERRNQSTGPASIDARGGEEVELRVDVEADSQTVLEQIADADAQRYFAGGGERFTGQVALNPLASDRDLVSLRLPRLALAGAAWDVTSWRYPLGDMRDTSSALMPITCERRVGL